MHPEVHIFGSLINVYMLFVLISFVAAAIYGFKELTKIDSVHKDTLFLVIIGGFFVQYFGGAAVGYLYKWIYFNQAPTLSSFNTAGRYFHSTFLAVLVYIFIFCAILRWPIMKILDIFGVATLMMSGIERAGCFFQGCCSGKPTNLPWGVRFPASPDVPVHPTQLYMLAIELFLCLLLIQKNKRKKYDGEVFWTAVLWYSAYRIFIEFVRTNPVFLLGLTHAQVFSVITYCIAYIVLRRNKMKYSQPKASQSQSATPTA